jgi:hypothetical protein
LGKKGLEKMRILVTLFITIGSSFSMIAQEVNSNQNKQGDFFVYWGWNRSAYTNSDIRFYGDNYDFTIDNAVARDRQTPFSAYDYFNPTRITIPQFNARVGYFVTDRYSISIGSDHMKYVVDSNQVVNMTGYIERTGTDYDGVYSDTSVVLATDLVRLEHTDGLNYINVELRRVDDLKFYNKVSLHLIEGIGAGIMIPKTNATLLNNERHDDFHVSGYGLNAMLGLQVNIGKHFFILSEFKGGFINLSNIRTTVNTADRGSQHFFFVQSNIVFGFRMNLTNR